MTLSQWLLAAAQRLTIAGIAPDEARVEARLLAQYGLGLTREQALLRADEPIETARLEPLLVRRQAREPLAYIVGEREFFGLSFLVTPDVLIPRPETELLGEAALLRAPRSVADIGTGSGCIAVSLAKRLPGARVLATDLSGAALELARRNAARHGVEITFLQGDMLAPLPDGLLLDAIVSNPPYIAPGEAHMLAPEVLAEPHAALFDTDGDGLGFYRRLTTDAPAYLAPGGLLAVEVGMGQAGSVARLFTDAGFDGVEALPDLAGIERVVCGTWPRPFPTL